MVTLKEQQNKENIKSRLKLSPAGPDLPELHSLEHQSESILLHTIMVTWPLF